MITSEEVATSPLELKTYRKLVKGDGINNLTIGGSPTDREIESLVSEDECAAATFVGQVSVPLQVVQETGLKDQVGKAYADDR